MRLTDRTEKSIKMINCVFVMKLARRKLLFLQTDSFLSYWGIKNPIPYILKNGCNAQLTKERQKFDKDVPIFSAFSYHEMTLLSTLCPSVSPSVRPY